MFAKILCGLFCITWSRTAYLLNSRGEDPVFAKVALTISFICALGVLL